MVWRVERRHWSTGSGRSRTEGVRKGGKRGVRERRRQQTSVGEDERGTRVLQGTIIYVKY